MARISTRPPLQRLIRAALSQIFDDGQDEAAPPAPTWTPAALFANGESGAWWDISDISTLKQNSDGTGSVAVGDPVGYIADKSGAGRHAIQATSTSRGILRLDGNGCYYIELDGVDDTYTFTALTTATRTFASAVFFETGGGSVQHQVGNGATTHTFLCTPSTNWQMTVNSVQLANALWGASFGSFVVGVGVSTPSGGKLRTNRLETTNATAAVSATWSRLHGRGTTVNVTKGRWYGTVLRNADTTAEDIVKLEDYLAAAAGVTL